MDNLVEPNSKTILHRWTGWTAKLLQPSRSMLPMWIFCTVLALTFLLIGSTSSPLFPFNGWVDSNAFMTMGKGMMKGLVPYRDLFEQKGPLLYFIHGLASLFTPNSFTGIFVIEAVAFASFLYFSFKSMALFIERKFALAILPLLAFLIPNLISFSYGDSAEEFALPLLAYSLYVLLAYFKSGGKPLDAKAYFWNGLIAGCILWTKFTFIGFWLGWTIAIFVCEVASKRFLAVLKGGVIFLGGMAAATIPWVIYFGLNHAIYDWIHTYLYINLTLYPFAASFAGRWFYVLQILASQFLLDPAFAFLLWLGIISTIVFKRLIPSRLHRVLLAGCCLLLLFSVFGGGRAYIYYYLILSPLIIFGLMALFDGMSQKHRDEFSIRSAAIAIIATLLITVPLTLKFGQNSTALGSDKQSLVQFKFAAVINQTKNPTLLNYGSLDMGFYLAARVMPDVKYFELQNLKYSNYPLNIDEQNRYVREGVTDYVVFRISPKKDLADVNSSVLNQKYQLAASDQQIYDGVLYTYYLYKRIGLSD